MKRILLLILILVLSTGCSSSGVNESRIKSLESDLRNASETIADQMKIIDELSFELGQCSDNYQVISDKLDITIENHDKEYEEINTRFSEYERSIRDLSNSNEHLNYLDVRLSILMSYIENTEEYHVVYGRIEDYSDDQHIVSFDDNEWIDMEDDTRINELGLNADEDFPNGYSLHNEDEGLKEYIVDDLVIIYNLTESFQYTGINSSDYEAYLEEDNIIGHFSEVIFSDGIVVAIIEKYTP